MKTKSFLISLILVFAVSNFAFTQSFTDKFSYEEFVSWAKDQDIDGFIFQRTEKTSEEDFGKPEFYAAAYIPDDNTTNLMITFSEIHTFTNYLTMSKYKNQPTFEINGHTSVYLPNDATYSTSMLWIEMPELDANIMILKSPLRTKDELIEIYNSLDLDALVKD